MIVTNVLSFVVLEENTQSIVSCTFVFAAMISFVCPSMFIVGTKKLRRMLKTGIEEWRVHIFSTGVQYFRRVFKSNKVGIEPGKNRDVENGKNGQ